MPVTDSRICPLASLRLYDPGQGDPVLTDHGFGWYDVLAESWALGTSQLDANGEQLLEYLEGVGVVCRPFIKLQDTRAARWTTSGTGTWEEVRPSTGAPRKYRFVQYDTAAALTWSATLDHNLPANPSFAFSLVFVDTPPDQDTDTAPPYFRVEMGHNSQQWALEFSKVNGARLLGYNDDTSAWEVVASLPEPERQANADNGETLIVVRVLRDQLCISVDRGRNYHRHPLPRNSAGAALPVRTGRVIIRGQGGQAVFGLHQVRYYTGHYTSPPRNTLTTRVAPTATIAGRYSLPPGTAIAFSDQSAPAAQTAKWRATLTPATHPTASFNFYSTPELYAAQFTYPVARDLPWLSYQTPWDHVPGTPGGLTNITISKPYELAASSAKVSIRLDPNTQFAAALRLRKAELRLGELDADGSTTRTEAVWVGYIAAAETLTEEFNSQDLDLELVTLATILQRQEWTDFTRVPLGGQTVNQALNDILVSCGLEDFSTAFGFPFSYVSWHVVGDNLTLPSGTPEKPFEWPPAGESKWETLTRIAGYAGLEIAVLDDGTLSSGPQKYVSPYVSHQLRMEPDDTVTDGLKRALKSIRYRVDYLQSVTAVLVKGADLLGRALYSWARDTFAETFPLADRYSPFRELHQEEISYPVDPGGLVLATRTQALALEGFPVKYEPDVQIPVNLDVVRRDRVQIIGANVGILDWHEFAVLTLQHRYVAGDPGFARMETTAGLRRVYP